jgi:hypothetical protein
LSGGGWCFITASKNSMLFASAHLLFPVMIMHVKPFSLDEGSASFHLSRCEPRRLP